MNENSNERPSGEELSPPASLLFQLYEYRRPILVILLFLATSIVLLTVPLHTLRAIFYVLIAQRLLVFLLVIFSLLALSLLWAEGEQLDRDVFLFFNQHGLRTQGSDRFMWIITQLGNGIFAFLLAGVFYFLGMHRLGIGIVLGTLTLWLTVEITKILADRARPFLTLAQTTIVGWRERGRSFPSGHTSQTFFLATLLVLHFHLGIVGSLLLYSIAAFVGFTRVYIGVHYPRDVLGGAILGSVWGILGALVDAHVRRS
jgi:membrane-associated phospholipid phosphatase